MAARVPPRRSSRSEHRQDHERLHQPLALALAKVPLSALSPFDSSIRSSVCPSSFSPRRNQLDLPASFARRPSVSIASPHPSPALIGRPSRSSDRGRNSHCTPTEIRIFASGASGSKKVASRLFRRLAPSGRRWRTSLPRTRCREVGFNIRKENPQQHHHTDERSA